MKCHLVKRRLQGSSKRTINMDVGALRQVLRRLQWRRLEDDVKMLTEAGGAPVGRALAPQDQKLPFEARRHRFRFFSFRDTQCLPNKARDSPRVRIDTSRSYACQTNYWSTSALY